MKAFVENQAVIVDTRISPFARLQPIPHNHIYLENGLWESRHRVNLNTTLDSQYVLLESTERFNNFRRVSEQIDKPYQGLVFNDSDVYKWLEAASWSMVYRSDDQLCQKVNQVISLITKAQDKNGYLNTFFSRERSIDRWTNLREKHELYCAGHLIQAAVAHYRVTGEKQLMEVAIGLADHIHSVFGQSSSTGTPGHPEIEMAMVELYRTTRQEKYLNLATSFIDRRGHKYLGGSEYLLDHLPFRELKYLTGHAVRALYLCAGATDLFLETGELELKTTLERLWANMVRQQMYITGGLGARHDGEAFGDPYELPNARAYAETCAAIASIMWNWRMLQINGDARYSDLLEWTFYNAVLPAISLDGQEYFYVNPLKADRNHRRQSWFECACCPPNICRTMAEFPGYMCSISAEGIWIHQYAASRIKAQLMSGLQLEIIQITNYPWDGRITLHINDEKLENKYSVKTADEGFSVFLRLPGWLADREATVKINGEKYKHDSNSGSYLEIHRNWQVGDVVDLDFPMDVIYIESHPRLVENSGRMAIIRGPLVYCLEEADNPDILLSELVLSQSTRPVVEFLPDLLGGIALLHLVAKTHKIDPGWETNLYRPINEQLENGNGNCIEVHSIPYFAWANRKPGKMEIWHLHN